MTQINEFSSLSKHNRDELLKAKKVSCYFCIRHFDSSEITEWADKGQTGICPHCTVDALVPGEYDTNVLAKACEKWFGGR